MHPVKKENLLAVDDGTKDKFRDGLLNVLTETQASFQSSVATSSRKLSDDKIDEKYGESESADEELNELDANIKYSCCKPFWVCLKYLIIFLKEFIPNRTPISILTVFFITLSIMCFARASNGLQPTFTFYGVYLGVATSLLLFFLTINIIFVKSFKNYSERSKSKFVSSMTTILQPEGLYLIFTIFLFLFWRMMVVDVESTRTIPDNSKEISIFFFSNFTVLCDTGDREILQKIELIVIIWACRDLFLKLIMFWFLLDFLKNLNRHVVKYLSLYALISKLNSKRIALCPLKKKIIQSASISHQDIMSLKMTSLSPKNSANDIKNLSQEISFKKVNESGFSENPHIVLDKLDNNEVGNNYIAEQVKNELKVQQDLTKKKNKFKNMLNSKHDKTSLNFIKHFEPKATYRTIKGDFQVQYDGDSIPYMLQKENINEVETSSLTNMKNLYNIRHHPLVLSVRGTSVEILSKRLARLVGQRLFEELIEIRDYMYNDLAPKSSVRNYSLNPDNNSYIVDFGYRRPTRNRKSLFKLINSTINGHKKEKNIPNTNNTFESPYISPLSPEYFKVKQSLGGYLSQLKKNWANRISSNNTDVTIQPNNKKDCLDFNKCAVSDSISNQSQNRNNQLNLNLNTTVDSVVTDKNTDTIIHNFEPNMSHQLQELYDIHGSHLSDDHKMYNDSLELIESNYSSASHEFVHDQSKHSQYNITYTEENGSNNNIADDISFPIPDSIIYSKDQHDIDLDIINSNQSYIEYNTEKHDYFASPERIPSDNIEDQNSKTLLTDGPAVLLTHSGNRKEKELDKRNYLNREFLSVFLENDVDNFFFYLDLGGRNKVSFKDFTNLIVDLYKTRKQLLAQLQSQERIRDVFRRMVAVFLSFIALLIFLGFIGISVNTIIISGAASLSSITVALSYFYSSFIKSVMFVCFLNPYNVGDRVRINGQLYIVKKISTYYTEFVNVPENKPCFWNHTVLYDTIIINESRSEKAGLEIPIFIAYETNPNKYEKLHKFIENYVDNDPDFVKGSCFCLMFDVVIGHYIKFTYWITCSQSWHRWQSILAARSRIWNVIIRECNILNIKYHLPVQPYNISRNDMYFQKDKVQNTKKNNNINLKTFMLKDLDPVEHYEHPLHQKIIEINNQITNRNKKKTKSRYHNYI